MSAMSFVFYLRICEFGVTNTSKACCQLFYSTPICKRFKNAFFFHIAHCASSTTFSAVKSFISIGEIFSSFLTGERWASILNHKNSTIYHTVFSSIFILFFSRTWSDWKDTNRHEINIISRFKCCFNELNQNTAYKKFKVESALLNNRIKI